MKIFLTILTIAGAAFTVAACGSAPEGTPASEAQASLVTIHWTDVDPGTGKTITRAKQITREQAQWLLDTRAKNRTVAGRPEQPAIAAVEPGAEHVRSTSSQLTSSSTDWTDCQSYAWLLVTSGSDGSGDIFCATFTAGALDTVAMPFVPQWYDSATASSAFFNLCSGSSEYDCMLGECGGSNRWTTIRQDSGTSNISPPSSVVYIMAQDEAVIC